MTYTTLALDCPEARPFAGSGCSEMMKIAAMASAWNVTLIPYVWGTNVGLATSVQFFAALLNLLSAATLKKHQSLIKPKFVIRIVGVWISFSIL